MEKSNTHSTKRPQRRPTGPFFYAVHGLEDPEAKATTGPNGGGSGDARAGNLKGPKAARP